MEPDIPGNDETCGHGLLWRCLAILGVAYPLVYLPWTYRTAAAKAFTIELFVALGLAGFLFARLKSGRIAWKTAAVDLPLAAFVVWCVASASMSAYSAASWNALRQLLFMGGFYVVLRLALRTPHDVKRLLGCWILGAALGCSAGLIEFSCLDSVLGGEGWTYRRVDGKVFQHPNVFGLYMAWASPVLLSLGWKPRRKRSFLVLFLTAIVLSLSRGTMLGLASGLIVFAVLRRLSRQDDVCSASVLNNADVAPETSSCGRLFRCKANHWKAMGAGAVLLMVCILVCTYMPAFQKDRLLSWAHGSNARRPHIYKATLEMIRDRPLLGFGFGTYEVVFQEYKSPQLASLIPETTMNFHAHNDFLQMLAETGAAGGLLYLLVWFVYAAAIVRGIQRGLPEAIVRLQCGLAGGMAAIVAHNMFNVDSRYLTIQVLTTVTLAGSATLLPPIRRIRLTSHPPRVRVFADVVSKALICTAAVLLAFSAIGTFRRFASSLELERADRLIDSGPWPGMEEAARRATEWDSNSTQAWYELGYSLLKQEKWSAALAAYERVKRINPNWANVDVNMANCYAFVGDWPAVAEHARRALRIHPHSDVAHFLAGKASYAAGDEELAFKHFEVFLSHNPDHAETLFYTASILESLGRMDEASERYEASRRSNPALYRVLTDEPESADEQ